MSKHTPGPWETSYCSVYSNGEERKNIIAMAMQQDIDEMSEVRANARLIAAAPELLEALQALLKAEWMVSNEWGGDRKSVLSKATEAIAKATGEKEQSK